MGAHRHANHLREELEARGLRVSIELQRGRPGTPNGRWFDTRFVGCLGHHIVSRRSSGNTPALSLVKRGRPDLPGPLANGYLGFDLVARIITMGWANHPGAGGPMAVPGFVIPEDNGRPYLFGWEHEGGISEADWNFNGGEMREAMGKCHAATVVWLDRDARSYAEHKTWAPGRKVDRLGYTTAEGRAELRRFLDRVEGTDVLRMNQRGDGAAVAAQVAANRAYRASNRWRNARGLPDHQGQELVLDDWAGPRTHDRINDLLDIYYSDKVSRRGDRIVTSGALSLLVGIEHLCDQKIADRRARR